MAHEYVLTDRIEGVRPNLPTMRDPDNLCYFREEVGGLCMGGYERKPAPWGLDGIPGDFNGRLLEPDWPRFEEIMTGAVRRVPAIADAGITRMINGPEAFTPDNEFVLGESEVRGFFVAAGFCAHGIAGAAGIGRQLATWIVDGEPELDLWNMDIRRFGAQYLSAAYTLARTTENYATYYDIHYLGSRHSTASSARNRVGSGRTGSSPTRQRATRPGVREAGPASIGAQPSAPRRSQRVIPRPFSTRRASPRSRSADRGPPTSSSTCARTTWTVR